MKRSFLPESELRRIVHHARHELPRAFQPDDKSAVDPRCVGSRVVQTAACSVISAVSASIPSRRRAVSLLPWVASSQRSI